MRPALWSIAIQGAGSAATVASALLVSSQMGLAAQGEFGLLRTWNDAIVTLAVIGLPQGLLHMQYRASVPIAALSGWVGRYAACLLALLVVLAGVASWAGPMVLRMESPLRSQTVMVLALAVAFGAVHALWRSLALREVGVVPYAALTAAPALLILVGLVPVCLTGRTGGFVWTLFGAAALSALVSGLVVRRAVRRAALAPAARVEAEAWSRRTLWSVSAETGAQSVLTAMCPALMLSIAGWRGGSLAQIGAVSLGLYVYQAFSVAAGYVGPMVYDRAARAERPLTGRELTTWLRQRTSTPMRFAFGAAVLLAGVLILPWWPRDADALVLLAAMAVAGVLSLAARLIVTLMLARGAFRPLTVQALLRLLIVTGGTALLMQFWPATLAVPIALACTEALLLVLLLRLMR